MKIKKKKSKIKISSVFITEIESLALSWFLFGNIELSHYAIFLELMVINQAVMLYNHSIRTYIFYNNNIQRL